MAIIYIDESGDLGMDCKHCTHFILTAVKINDEDINTLYKRIPKEIRQRELHKKTKKTAELKFSNSSVLIKERYLKRAAKLDIDVFSLIINKKYTSERLKDNLPILYNYLIKILLERVFSNLDRKGKLKIFLDRAMSHQQRENFENYIKTEFFHIFQDVPDVEILHENSQNNEGLQVTDFICGAFGYKYNTAKLKGDCNCYVNLIQDTIKLERNDLFKEKTTPAYWS